MLTTETLATTRKSIVNNGKIQKRPVQVRIRSISGSHGTVIRWLGPLLTWEKYQELFGHWSLQVGDHSYELYLDDFHDKSLTFITLTGGKRWLANLAEEAVGYTTLSDDEILEAGEYITHLLK